MKKVNLRQYIVMAVFVLMGGCCGFIMADCIGRMFGESSKPADKLPMLLLLFAAMYLAIFVQTVIHEAGHLIFGLLTGYKFSSFRIGSFMLLKSDGKLSLKRLSIAGMGGQCLMTPPDMKDGRIPFVFYNLGGSLINIISTIIFGVLMLLFGKNPILSAIMLFFALIGAVFALMNGLPLRLGTVNNDGYNAFELGKDKLALKSFWIQMKVNECIARGERLKDMPGEWFEVPAEEEMKNSMTAVVGVFACNRFMDMGKFAEADALTEKLLSMDTGIVGLHRSLMICDRIYCGLVGADNNTDEDSRKDRIDKMLDIQQKKFMKSMKNFPSVLRTEYVYALLAERDTAKAEKLKAQFEKAARKYPYQSDIKSEYELMEYAERTFDTDISSTEAVRNSQDRKA